jgi:nuclear GTP-binding protein
MHFFIMTSFFSLKKKWLSLRLTSSKHACVQVLDARDPEGTRCKFLESHLRKNHKDKHLIVILNKVDLVPPWVTKKWLRVLSSEFPVLAFRAGLQHPFGMGALLSLLRQIARLRSDKKTVSVGFIGYPNVGKSSVINTLRRKKVRGNEPSLCVVPS